MRRSLCGRRTSLSSAIYGARTLHEEIVLAQQVRAIFGYAARRVQCALEKLRKINQLVTATQVFHVLAWCLLSRWVREARQRGASNVLMSASFRGPDPAP